MKLFVEPEVQIIALRTEDVLFTLSGVETPGDGDWMNGNNSI